MAQNAVPVRSDHPFQDGRTALGVDAVGCGPVTDPHVEPGGLSSDAPARLVGRDVRGGPHVVEEELVVRFKPRGGAHADLGAGPARHVDAEQGVENRRDLAVRQARLRVQQRRRRLGFGADLTGGRSQGVGGLQVVPALHASAAAGAVADMHPKLSHDGPTRNLGLKLLGHFTLDKSAVAVGASVGERGVKAFVDAFRRRRGSMAVLAVGVAGLAAGGFRVRLGRPLTEGSGLPFAGAQGVRKAPGQLRDLAFEFADALTHRLTIGAGRLFHTAMIGTRRSVSCANLPLLD